MSEPLITVVVPTLRAGPVLGDCIRSLEQQSRRDFHLVIVDNSGQSLVKAVKAARFAAKVIENKRNAGFGAAINQVSRSSSTPYLATLNDDAITEPQWIEALVDAIEARPDVGMCASKVILTDSMHLDSAGMLICGDGSSKQRGHREKPGAYHDAREVLFPSGSAALYRQQMLAETGFFDEDFFLYCEDTDLGLRAQWAGWKCLYVPDAVVHHHYSQSAGAASQLKAYYVERNRLFVVVKNFPAGLLMRAPFVALARYFWHVVSIFLRRGTAAEFQREGGNPLWLIWYVLRAHAALLAALPRLWRQRRTIQCLARITSREFLRLVRENSINSRQVAAQ